MDRKQEHNNPGKSDASSSKPTPARGILKLKSPAVPLFPTQTKKHNQLEDQEDDFGVVVPAVSTRDLWLGTSVQSKSKPISGIAQENKRTRKKSQRWDEMNIMATYHPSDKEYGHMRVDEPPTPFERAIFDGTEEDTTQITPELLAERLAAMDGISPQLLQAVEGISSSGQFLDPQAKDEFLAKRKAHYNEGRHLSKPRAQRTNSQELYDATELRPGESEGKIHLRLAQQLLQEKEGKTNLEDMEFLAPVLIRRTSGPKAKAANAQMQKGSQQESDRKGVKKVAKDSSAANTERVDDSEEVEEVLENSPVGEQVDDFELEEVEDSLDAFGEQVGDDDREDATPSNEVTKGVNDGVDNLPSQPSTSTSHSPKGKKTTK